ncbi:ankyrin repeat domain-containing protein [Thermodesulfobacteriota bacterium]
MEPSIGIRRKIGLCLAALVLFLSGCTLPFPGPYEGRVTDAKTGRPIVGAKVEAEWWCHDNPLPDGPGSFFVRSSTVTDEQGRFRLAKETRRGGWFGSSFALKITADGYIPATLIGDPSGYPLPASTKAYPFVRTSTHRRFPAELDVKLAPAVTVWLKALGSGIPLHQRVAREKLTKLLGVDHGYQAHKWKKAVESGGTSTLTQVKRPATAKHPGCPCPESVNRSRHPKEKRRSIRKLLKAAASGDTQEVKRLIAAGLECNARNRSCRTALMKAASGSSPAMVEFLLSKGADVNAKSKDCRTALMFAALRYGNREIAGILLSHGANVNARDRDEMTALMHAAKFGHAGAVEVLLSNGADVNLKDKVGETAWFKAAVVKQKDVMDILESHGANPSGQSRP